MENNKKIIKKIIKEDYDVEAPILWPPDAYSWLTGRPDAGEDWQ